MFIKSSVGQSQQVDALSAGREAAELAIEKLVEKQAQLIIVFSSVVFDQKQMLKGVRKITKDTPLVGCSTAGEIVTNGPSKKSVVVMAIAAQGVNFHFGIGKNIKDNPLKAGNDLGRDLLSKTKAGKLAIMLPDGLAGNGADVVRGMQKALGEHFLIVGGAAGDDFLFKETYEYYNDQVLTGAVVGVMIEGDARFGIGVRHGWNPIGASKKVTKSKGNILYELDNKPAVHIYEEYFGKKAEELKSEPLARMAIIYPLGQRIPNSDEYLIRDPITVGDKGEITCAAEVPEGSEINLMMGSREQAISAAQQAAQQCVQGFKENGGSKVTTALIFNCIARDKLLGRDAQKEIEVIKKVLGESAEMIGFYTYGEQAPIGKQIISEQKSCRAEFCNETVVIVGFGE
jgi:hypothetical protein